MTRWAAINYRDFWDFPRIFFLTDGEQLYLFDCEFDEAAEDFSEEYRVYLMPALTAEELAGPWDVVAQRATADLGRVPTTALRFDPTKRKFVDASVLDSLPARPARAPG